MKRPVRIDGNIAYVQLACGKEALIDAEDAEIVGQHNWRLHSKGYAVTDVRFANGQRTWPLLHRLIMNPPEGVQIDHIHGNKLDNRKAQLRFATSSQNSQNQGISAKNTSGFKGVYWHTRDKKWMAKIHITNKQVSLGCFTTPEAAHQAYCEAARRLHGDFSRVA